MGGSLNMPEKYRRQRVPVSKIDLDLKNSRFSEIATSQSDAVQKILEKNRTATGNKVVTLANHILQHGLNPVEQIVLIETKDGRFIDKEGNRRLTALKLLKKPSILADECPEKKSFHKLNQKLQQKNITLPDPFCIIFDNEDEADLWVEVIHTGEQSGVGRAKWGSQEKDNHKARRNRKKSSLLQVREFIEQSDFLSPEDTLAFRNFSHTNLNRLLSSEYVRRQLGLEFIDGEAHLIAPEQEVIKAFSQIIYDFVTNPDESARKKVADIYTKEKRIEYIDGLKSFLPQTRQTAVSIATCLSEPEQENNSTGNEHKKKNRVRPRRGMIPVGIKPENSTEKFIQVIHELESLDYKNYPIATAVLFRIFLETATYMFLVHTGHLKKMKGDVINSKKAKYEKENGTLEGFDYNNCINLQIWPQISDMLSYIEKAGILNDDPSALRALSEFKRKNSESIIHIDSLNFYAHNAKSSIPSPDNLFQFWQELEGFFKIVLNTGSVK